MTNRIAARAGVVLGLLAGLASMPASAVSLITNGGFEAGNFSGWTTFGDLGDLASYASVSSESPVPHTGMYGASFGTQQAASLTQSFSTVSGATYLVDFWLQSEADAGGLTGSNSFQFKFGSQTP